MSQPIAITTIHSQVQASSTSAPRDIEPAVQDTLVQDAQLREQRLWRSREIEVLEDERRRLARDLHDESGHRLTAAVLKLDIVVQRYSHDAELRESLESARRMIQECAAGLHDVAFNLRPCILADLGLVPAIRSLVRRAKETTGLQMIVGLKGTHERLSETIELTAFRVVQEALTNALKYAHASTIKVDAMFCDEAVEIKISDDGIGFDVLPRFPDRPQLGLKGIRERVDLVGGEMKLQTQPGRGTTVWVRLPRIEAT